MKMVGPYAWPMVMPSENELMLYFLQEHSIFGCKGSEDLIVFDKTRHCRLLGLYNSHFPEYSVSQEAKYRKDLGKSLPHGSTVNQSLIEAK